MAGHREVDFAAPRGSDLDRLTDAVAATMRLDGLGLGIGPDSVPTK